METSVNIKTAAVVVVVGICAAYVILAAMVYPKKKERHVIDRKIRSKGTASTKRGDHASKDEDDYLEKVEKLRLQHFEEVSIKDCGACNGDPRNGGIPVFTGCKPRSKRKAILIQSESLNYSGRQLNTLPLTFYKKGELGLFGGEYKFVFPSLEEKEEKFFIFQQEYKLAAEIPNNNVDALSVRK